MPSAQPAPAGELAQAPGAAAKERINASDSEGIRRFKATNANVSSELGRLKGSSFQPRPDDVVIATPAKCGTTWVSQIVQSLRSGGNLDFDEISLVIPFLEQAHVYGYTDLDAPQPAAAARAYKTHFWRPHCPQGAKTIVVVRDPLDVGPSFYHFLSGWMFEAGSISMDAFLREFWLDRGAPSSALQEASFWHFLASWWPHGRDPDVLWLHFEDLAADLPACVGLIADFMGVADPQLRAVAAEQASLKSMKQHASKYDDHVVKIASNRAAGRPEFTGLGEGSTGKVREGQVGANQQQLSPELRAAVEAKWREVVLPATGHGSYQELRRAANAELGRPF